MKLTTEMITQVIIFIIIFIIAIVFNACKGKDKKNVDEVIVQNSEVNPYFDLRNQAIKITSEQLKIKLDNDNDIYGIVMDWNMDDAIITVVAFKTGDASIYLSTGQVFIGGYAHEEVINAAKQFVIDGKKYISKAVKIEKTEPVKGNKIDFYFLTNSGKFYIEDDFVNIENNTSEYLKLFESGNKVITEYRLISDKK